MRRHTPKPQMTNLELFISIVMTIAIVATLVIFLFVFHDVPFRTS